jgi:hypothetical protein
MNRVADANEAAYQQDAGDGDTAYWIIGGVVAAGVVGAGLFMGVLYAMFH